MCILCCIHELRGLELASIVVIYGPIGMSTSIFTDCSINRGMVSDLPSAWILESESSDCINQCLHAQCRSGSI